MRRCAPNFCQDLEEASELTTNAQRVASALHAYRAHIERIQGAHVKNPTNAQRVARARNEWSAHAPRIQRTDERTMQRSRDCAARLACRRHIFWGGSCRHNQQEPPSSPMRVGGGVMMIPHGYTLRSRLEHARRTLGALQISFSTRSARPYSLHVRWTCVEKHASCALGVR